MIRHHLAGVALGLALGFSSVAFAQAPALTPGHLQAAREVVDLTGVTGSLNSIYAEFKDRTRQIVGITRPEMAKDMNEVIDSLKPEADKKHDEINTAAVEIFARRMTEADLKEVATFFKSPVGQRYNAARPQALEELYNKVETWSVETSNFLFDRFTQEMRKRGHQM